MSYELLKVLHVFGAVIFLGNIVVTALWKTLADRTRDPIVIGFAQRLITVTDIAFTATGATLLAVSGALMATAHGHPFWLTWGIALFAASGVLWVAILIPVQIGQARLARGFRHGGEIPAGYWRLSTAWMVFGIIATALPLVNVYLMVAQPV